MAAAGLNSGPGHLGVWVVSHLLIRRPTLGFSSRQWPTGACPETYYLGSYSETSSGSILTLWMHRGMGWDPRSVEAARLFPGMAARKPAPAATVIFFLPRYFFYNITPLIIPSLRGIYWASVIFI
jgi:hypothetical protein